MAFVMAMRIMAMIVMPVRVVNRMLDMLRLLPTRLSEEGQEDQSPAVEAGQQRGEYANAEGIHCQGPVAAKAASMIASFE